MPDTRTDVDADGHRVLSGAARDIETGPTPGAVAHLRANLRDAAKNLPLLNDRIRELEAALQLATGQRDICRTACDEFLDAIAYLERAR